MAAMSRERTAPRALRWNTKQFQFRRNVRKARLVVFGLVILGIAVICAIFAPLIAPYDPLKQDYLAIAQPTSAAHWLGADDLGRDVLLHIIDGSRVSFQVGAIAVVIAVSLGTPVGLVAGNVGGKLDDVIMRFVDAVQALPGLILALGLTAALGPSTQNVTIAIGFISSPATARLLAPDPSRCAKTSSWRQLVFPAPRPRPSSPGTSDRT